ncbi:alpha-L-fucosidase [Flavivirga rizhaonensis]|uniref:alpha-L-fucosidase n=1 Tax=Flavivirga rizhaonensis TaxID=2559571 RepID=A0A4S1E0Y0_9FLAO|nr:alpha-L-fucosidase [Flavivirga rizhaonensis]TGV04207.1 alpha-L-fucosidase [Flavivirga rizhaonensis]
MKRTIVTLFAMMLIGQVFAQKEYKANWQSLKNYEAPEWYEDAKLGFWVHWGVYSVPAFMGAHAAEWYGRWMYCHKGQERDFLKPELVFEHHKTTYGDQSKFGYKDFIPMFKAENFDANEWADLCVQGGAKYFCMMGTHHDSFCMWDTKLTKWNSVDMGPKRDLVGELKTAVTSRGLKFGVSNHSAWNYAFFQFNHLNNHDAVDIANQDLYGTPILSPVLDTIRYIPGEGRDSWLKRVKGTVKPSERDLNRWLERTKELCDLYQPDLYYFDWGMNIPEFETRRREFGKHYYNKAIEWGTGKYGNPGVVLNYKNKAFPYGAAVKDHERGGEGKIAPMVWQTDDCVYNGNTWGYSSGVPIKSTNTIIDELVDIVSKRGVLMLSFAPKADGSFPEDQKRLIKEMGSWLNICGEAIYATRPWNVYGEKGNGKTATNVRFTRNKAKTVLYTTLLDWISGEITIKSINSRTIPEGSIQKVSLIGVEKELDWKIDKYGFTVILPKNKPVYNYAYPIRIELKNAIEMTD